MIRNHHTDKMCIYENFRSYKEGTRKNIQRNNGLKLPNPGQEIDIHIKKSKEHLNMISTKNSNWDT